MKELISVIIPVYNTEQYLKRCIESVLKQTYKNIEVILVDDGSTDNSLTICNEYANIDNRVSVIHQRNSGVSTARNQGIEIMKGKYFICIDSDDWIEPNMIETLYNYIKNNDADISICNFYINKESGEQSIKNEVKKQELILTDIKGMYENLFDEKMFGGYLWNKLIKTSIIKDNTEKILFNEKIAIEEDVLFLIEVFKKCSKICYDSRIVLYHYFQRSTSAVRFNYQLKDLTKIEVLEKKLKIKEKYDIKSLNRLEYDYIFLLNQAIFIAKSNKIDKNIYKQKLKLANKKYFKLAIKTVRMKKKIKLIAIEIFPILYSKLSKRSR